jgi:hypothetical protein
MSSVYSNKHSEDPIAQMLSELTADESTYIRVSELDFKVHFSL